MATYTSIDLVRSELKGLTINSTEYPLDSDITVWINEVEAFIDSITGTSYKENTVTDEYYDYNGEGYLFLNHYPIISITSLEYNKYGIGDSQEEWITMSEGRTIDYDFIIETDVGKVIFHGNNNDHYITAGQQKIRVTYTWGKSSVPLNIQRIATLLVAKRYLSVIANDEAINGGSLSVGPINVGEVLPSLSQRIKDIDVELEQLWNTIGTFKNYAFKW